jgi:RNA polymerase sigma-70 factor (ECF subfamily)
MIFDSSDISFTTPTLSATSTLSAPARRGFATAAPAAPAETPIAETVCAAQRGDRHAFGQLVERYQRAVYLTVYRRLRNHAETQEVCQDVFIQAMRKIGQLQDARCFGSWLRSIAGRMAINRAMRRRATVSVDTAVLEAGCYETRTPLVTMLARERNEQVRQGLRRLRALDRRTLTAFYLDGSSLLEMSEQFASPVGTIKRRLHVARKRLAKELESLGCG